MSVGAEEPLVEDTEAPLVYNTEEGTSENLENVVEGTTEGVVEGEDETVIDSSEPTSEGIASTENEVETLQEENSSVESLPELATFEKEIIYNEEHTVATVILTYTGECTELNIANADEVQEFVNIGVYRANMEKGDWETKISFDILLNGMIYFEINVWNNDKLIGTVPVRCSITGLNNDQLIFDPNQEPTTYEITSSDVGSSDSRNMTLSYETNVSFTWSIPTELSMADIEDDLTVTVNNSNLATETALRIRVSSNNYYKLIESESGDALSYIVTDLSGNKLNNGDVILDHLYYQDSTSNTIHFDLTQMPVMSGKYEDTLTFTASVERMLQDLYSGQVVTLSNLGTTHNLIDMKIYGVSKQGRTPSPDNPVEIQSIVNPTVTVSGKNLLNSSLETATMNGVTCTQNIGPDGQPDGTYTLNGTASAETGFDLTPIIKNIYGGMKMLGTPIYPDHKRRVTVTYFDENFEWANYAIDTGNGLIISSDYPYIKITIWMVTGETSDNLVFKPMLTTDLNATYYDFEPYYEGYGTQSATLNYTLNAIPVDSGGNVTVNGQQYISDYVDIGNKKLVRMVGESNLSEIEFNSKVVDNEIQYYESKNSLENVKKPSDGNEKPNMISENYHEVVNGWKVGNRICIGINVDGRVVCGTSAIPDGKILYQLATPTEIDLTDAEVQAFKDLYTYSPTTVVSCSSNQLTPYVEFGLS